MVIGSLCKGDIWVLDVEVGSPICTSFFQTDGKPSAKTLRHVQASHMAEAGKAERVKGIRITNAGVRSLGCWKPTHSGFGSKDWRAFGKDSRMFWLTFPNDQMIILSWWGSIGGKGEQRELWGRGCTDTDKRCPAGRWRRGCCEVVLAVQSTGLWEAGERNGLSLSYCREELWGWLRCCQQCS
jgi:hypothetical protein